MTESIAITAACEHHYETRILGGRPISVRACVFCRTPDWADLDEQAAELYRWGWQEGRDGKAARETLSAYDKPRQAQDGPQAPQDGPGAPDAGAETRDGAGGRQTGAEPLARLQRLRAQLATEHAKAVRADQHPRPDLDHLRVTPHNGIAAGLEIALFFVGHHLREAGEAPRDEHVCKPGASIYYCPASGETESDCHGGFDVCCDRPDLHRPAHACGNCEGEDPDTCLNNPRRTTPDNPATSSDTTDNPLREQIAAAVEDEIYEYRERTMFWEEGGVTTEIARLATRGAMEAVEREMEQLRAKIAEFDHIINWHTTCASCARILDSAYAETVRAETAEQQRERLAAALREVLDAFEAYWSRASYCGPGETAVQPEHLQAWRATLDGKEQQ